MSIFYSSWDPSLNLVNPKKIKCRLKGAVEQECQARTYIYVIVYAGNEAESNYERPQMPQLKMARRPYPPGLEAEDREGTSVCFCSLFYY